MQKYTSNQEISDISHKIINSLLNDSQIILRNQKNSPIAFSDFKEVFPLLNQEQQKYIREIYQKSEKSVITLCIKANLGNTNDSAIEMFDFLMQNDFKFNKGDINFLNKKQTIDVEPIPDIGSIYELNWYYPINKWTGEIKKNILKKIGKQQNLLSVVKYPNPQILLLLIKHYFSLPKSLKNLTLKYSNQDKLKEILNKQQSKCIDFFA